MLASFGAIIYIISGGIVIHNKEDLEMIDDLLYENEELIDEISYLKEIIYNLENQLRESL